MGAALLSACTCASEPEGGQVASRDSSVRKEEAAAAKAEPADPKAANAAASLEGAQVTTVFEWKASAYRSALAVDGKVVTVVTEDAIHRITPGSPPQKRVVEVGSSPTFTQGSVIFWRRGQLISVPKGSGSEKILGEIQQPPRQVVAAGDRYAWLSQDAKGGSSIRTFKKGKEVVLYETKQALSAAVMLHDWVFFVESVDSGHFKIGGAPLSGQKPAFTPIKQGRTPSMLGAGEQLYYFDLMRRTLLRLSPDLLQESVVAENVVCSPFAVADQIYCARVEGLFALPLEGGTPVVLTQKPYGLVARVAASPQIVAWINETGDEHLSVRTIQTESTQK